MYEYMASAEQKADEIAVLYQKSNIYFTQKMDMIFDKYKNKYRISDIEARQLLNEIKNKNSIEEMLLLLRTKQYEKKEELLKQLEAPAYRARIERLQQLQLELDNIMEQVYQQEKTIQTEFYIDLVEKCYYRSIYEIQQRAGVAFPFQKISTNTIEKVVNSRWLGENYSSRIWKNTQKLADTIKTELLVNLLTGRTERETAELISIKFAQGASNARRLIRTESNYISSELNFKAYEECNIEKYQFLATLDLKTSKVCRALDGKMFFVKDKKIGVNCNPMHPWCRSTTIAVINREYIKEMQRSAIDPSTGRRILVPASMNYKEWYEKYVRNNKTGENLTIEEKGAIVRYISPDAYVLNDKLRRGEALTEHEKEWIIKLDKALEKLPSYKGDLNRSLTFVSDKYAKEFYDSFTIGNKYIPKQYLSATKNGVYNDEGQVQIYIHNAKTGKNLKGLNDMEQEVLYKRGSEFNVSNKIEKDGIYFILLEEVL